MTQSIALQVAYQGTNYYGWQKTAEGPSIEEELEKAIFQIFHFKPLLQAASRTDRGVHASGQMVQFVIDREVDHKRLLLGLNALLPKDIRIAKVISCDESFHPTLHALGKEYRYHLTLGSTAHPLYQHMSWHVPKFHLSSDVLQAIPLLTGTRDFKAFCNYRKDLNYETTIRTLQSINLFEEGPLLTFSLIGDHFLYKMARNIVGLLVQIGEGKFPLDEVPNLFIHRDRTLSGMTAPAHGLILHQVFYEKFISKKC